MKKKQKSKDKAPAFALPKKKSAAKAASSKKKERKQRTDKVFDESASNINFKVRPDDKAAIVKNAKRFAEGNLSGWIRQAAINHRPKKAA